MTYFLRLNDEAFSSNLPVIASFAEDFLEDGTRQISLGIKVEDPNSADTISAKLMGFYPANSITSLAIVGEDAQAVYITKAYHKLDALSLQLNLDQVQDDEDFGKNTAVSYNALLKA